MNSIDYLLSIETQGIKLGLKRTEKIMEACNNPHIGIKSIQVAGTNGKGSVCSMLSNIFTVSGYKTGLFTSPHLVNINERIRINGIPISNEKIDLFVKKYKNTIEDIKSTFFETITALAFWYFKKSNVDIAILETGLGGRLDSVTICNPFLTIITPIALDHTEILGDTLPKIAFEKSGIMKKNVDCISSKQEKSVKKILVNEANKRGCSIKFINNYKNINYKINICGDHQIENAQLCIFAISHIKNYLIKNSSIKKGLETVTWYGRNQIIKKKPHIIFDVAHNSSGIQAFLKYYTSLKIKGNSILVIALQSRKNITALIPSLTSNFKIIICTETKSKNSMPAESLGKLFINDNVKIINEPEKAILMGLVNLSNSDFMAIIGTHYLGPSIKNVFKISFDKY